MQEMEVKPGAEIGVADLEQEVFELGMRLGKRGRSLRVAKRSVLDRMMAMVSVDPGLRAALFRLVDVAPACSGTSELAEHLAAYLEEVETEELAVALGMRAAESPLFGRAAGRFASTMVKQMANRFIVGETVADAEPTLRRFWSSGIATTVDLLGEATLTESEGQAYADRCDDALLTLAAAAERWPAQPLLEADSVGPLPRINLSIKTTALTPLVRGIAPERGHDDAARHLRRLLRRASEVGAHLHIDMESMDSREMVLDLVLALLEEPEFAESPSTGIVLQAYLRDSEELLDRILTRTEAVERKSPLTVRLVKGAYWDNETIDAAQHGWASPVWTDKTESDRCFERLSRRLVDAFPVVRPAFASHNLRSVAHAVVYSRKAGLAPRDIEVQVLRGLGDDLQDSIAAAGLRCRTYCPVGDMVSGMAYLVRRLLENTSNASFLASQANRSDLEELLHAP
jgi:RHH-type proline utilization regulon transcriptional repressor/proline dehydrogenase/delta 1-pyrroline-5-carboxylate dehydrogenase